MALESMSSMTDQELPMKEYRRAGLEITRGNPEVYKVPVVATRRRHTG